MTLQINAKIIPVVNGIMVIKIIGKFIWIKKTLNINSREIVSKNQLKLKLTEKEINIILYLSNTEGTVKINELQKNVWGYQLDLETHTVETHIYRLRKKFLKIFDDKNFILSKKNGYEI